MAQAIPVIIGLVVSAVGTAVQISSQNQQAATERRAARYNYAMKMMQGDEMLAEAKRRATLAHEMGQRQMGRVAAAQAKSGAEVGTGSPLSVMVDQASQIAQDELAIIHEGELNKWRMQTGAGQVMWSSDQFQEGMKYKRAGTFLTGLGSAVSSGYRAYSGWGGGSGVGGSLLHEDATY